MTIKQLDINDKDLMMKIQKFVESKKDIDVKQTVEWGKFRNEEKILIYGLDDENKICLYANAFIIQDEELDEKIIYIPRGPVYNEKKYSLEESLIFICNFCKTIGYKYIKTNPRVKSIDTDKITSNNTKIYFTSKTDFIKQKESYREASLELKEKTEEMLLQSYHYKTRYNIRRSLKYGVVSKIKDNIDIDQFYKLYIMTAKRHDFYPHSKEYFSELLKIFDKKIVFGVTEYNGKILAMSINIKQNNTLFYLYGVSSNEERNKFACHNLHSAMIFYALNNEFEYYNFGGVFAADDDKENKDYGLLVFKSGFCINGLTEYVSDMLIEMEE